MYSNIGLSFRETVPLMVLIGGRNPDLSLGLVGSSSAVSSIRIRVSDLLQAPFFSHLGTGRSTLRSRMKKSIKGTVA